MKRILTILAILVLLKGLALYISHPKAIPGAFDRSGNPTVELFVGIYNKDGKYDFGTDLLDQLGVDEYQVHALSQSHDARKRARKLKIDITETAAALVVGNARVVNIASEGFYRQVLAEGTSDLSWMPRRQRKHYRKHFDSEGNPQVVLYYGAGGELPKDTMSLIRDQGWPGEILNVDLDLDAKRRFQGLQFSTCRTRTPMLFVGVRGLERWNQELIEQALREHPVMDV